MKSYILANRQSSFVLTAGLFLGDHFFYKKNYPEALEGYSLSNPAKLI